MPPNGGFGGNTGIHDAHNLAWKLAMVLKGRASPRLLETYESERKPVAKFTVEQAFSQVCGADGALVTGYSANRPAGCRFRYRAGVFVWRARSRACGSAHYTRTARITSAARVAHSSPWLRVSTIDLTGHYVLLVGAERGELAAESADGAMSCGVVNDDVAAVFSAFGISPSGSVAGSAGWVCGVAQRGRWSRIRAQRFVRRWRVAFAQIKSQEALNRRAAGRARRLLVLPPGD